MAAVTFENYDPNFNTLYQKGDVVVGGLNFGSGSSREQAATALKFKGIPCVIAGSFSETYKRNAFNNGFVVFECPELVTHLRATLKNPAPTTVASEITIDYAQIRSDHGRKIIRLSAAQSCGAGIDRHRRCRKSRRLASPRESVDVATALCRRVRRAKTRSAQRGGSLSEIAFDPYSRNCRYANEALLLLAKACIGECRCDS